jgi:hypothetical protein
VDPALLEAVAEARRTRGTVMLAADSGEKRWCAVCAAVDGRVELRVGEPAGGWLRRKGRAQEEWLAEHGFVHVIDAWSLPASDRTDEAYASALAEALEQGLGVERGEPLHRVLIHPGRLTEDVPRGEAPHVDHIAGALRDLATAGRGRVDFSGGRPAQLWAIVWVLADERALLVESELAGDPGSSDEWREPLSLDGADAAARELARRIPTPAEPLFVSFIDRDAED